MKKNVSLCSTVLLAVLASATQAQPFARPGDRNGNGSGGVWQAVPRINR